jgi:hypothetical protein
LLRPGTCEGPEPNNFPIAKAQTQAQVLEASQVLQIINPIDLALGKIGLLLEAVGPSVWRKTGNFLTAYWQIMSRFPRDFKVEPFIELNVRYFSAPALHELVGGVYVRSDQCDSGNTEDSILRVDLAVQNQ